MKNQQQMPDEGEIRWQIEKERLEKSRPRQKSYQVLNTITAIVILAAIAAAIYVKRQSVVQLWLRITGKAPVQVEEPAENDGPMIPGKDF